MQIPITSGAHSTRETRWVRLRAAPKHLELSVPIQTVTAKDIMNSRTPLRLILFPIVAILAAAFASAPLRARAEAPLSAQPRAIAPRGPLLPQEQSLVNLFENAAPSVAYIPRVTW